MCFMSYANNKGADQPAHPRSLISTFVVHCLDSVMSLVSITKISSLMLVSEAVQASLGVDLVWNSRRQVFSWQGSNTSCSFIIDSTVWAVTWQTNKMTVRPAKTQISLGIRPVWSESSLSAWRKPGSFATHSAHSKGWSDWADAQADLSLCWAHSHFVGFVLSRLSLYGIQTSGWKDVNYYL